MGSDDFIKTIIENYILDEENTKQERIERFIELNTLFGPQGDKLLQGGIQSQLALHEVANSYVCGNYMAVILLAQAFIEHSLSGTFIMHDDIKTAESSFKVIIDKAFESQLISYELHTNLNELRLLRNPYVHAKAGLKNGSLMKKMIDEKYTSAVDMSKNDALSALRILKDFMQQQVPMWFYETDET